MCSVFLSYFTRLLTFTLVLFFATALNAQQNNKVMPRAEMRVYLAQEESAKKVLETLLSFYGLKLIGDAIPNRPISGKFEVRNVEDIMSYFRSAYQINWFQNGINVYVYRSVDWRTKRVYVGGDRSNDEWKEYFTSAGLFYKEFPFVFHPDQKELVVSGPKGYINLVEQAFAVPPPDPSELEKHGISLMTFPLKHASVEDRQIALRGNLVVTPGVLTVLLNLLGLPSQPVSSTPENKSRGKLSNQGTNTPIGFGVETDRLATLPASNTKGVPDMAPKEKDPQQNEVTVTSDPRTNTILVRDAKSKYNYYKDLIESLDKPLAMVEVEALLVEVDQKGMQELGTEFGLVGRNIAFDFSAPGRNILSTGSEGSLGPGSFPAGITPGASSIVDPTRFMARLRALAADENAKVLARPTILTQDNVSAFIDLSQTLYFPVSGERVANLEPITAGSLLQVTPRLVDAENDERIFLRVEIQDGNLLPEDTIGFSRAARVQNTSLSTQAVIQRDKAILIGGYNRESSENREQRVPLLGRLPIVGRLFSLEEKATRTVSRLFLIVPRLIDRPIHDMPSTKRSIESLRKSFKVDGEFLEPTKTLRIDQNLTQ